MSNIKRNLRAFDVYVGDDDEPYDTVFYTIDDPITLPEVYHHLVECNSYPSNIVVVEQK